MVSVHSTQAFLGHALLVNMVQEVKGFQSLAKWLFLRLNLDVLVSCLYSPATAQVLVMSVEMTPPPSLASALWSCTTRTQLRVWWPNGNFVLPGLGP